MNYVNLSWRFAVLVMLMKAASIAAQESSIEEISVIATRSEQAAENRSGNVSLLGESELSRVAAQHIQQALSRVPGVSLQRGNGQESLPAIRSAVLTGAGACGSVLVMEEGIAVRGAGFCNINELFDTHYEQAHRIEVVRGASTAFYGSNALTGSVNVTLPASGENSLALEFGSNSYLRAKGALSYGEFGAAHGRLYLTLTDDGGYREQSGFQQQKASWRHVTEFGQWHLQAGATFANLDQETAGFIVGLDSYRDPVLARQNLNPEAFRKTRNLRIWLKGQRAFSERVKFNGAVYLRDTDMDFLQHFLPGDPLEQNAQTGFGWQSALHISVSDKLDWAVGIDGEISQGELQQTQDEPTRGSAFLRATIPSGTHYDYEVDADQLALFTHLDWRMSERWNLLAGARLESVRYDYDNLGLDGRTRDDGTECGFGGCRYSRPADRKDSFSHFSPKLELRYQATDQWRLSLAIADSFRAPQATELYRLQRAQTVADLDIVQARSIEATARYLNDSTQVSVTAYYLDSDNLIIRDSDFFNVDGQSTRSRGFELGLNQKLSHRWGLRAIGSVADHQYSSDRFLGDTNINGNQVDTAPKLFGSLFLDWRVSDRLSVEWELQHLSQYYLDPNNEHEYPGHTLLNMRATYGLSEDWTLSLRALNLSNQRYAERADFTNFSGERYFPGEPRSVFAEVRRIF